MSNLGRELYCDTRLGEEYWYIGYPRDADMHVARKVLDSVVFLAVDDGETKRIKGTAFLVGVTQNGLVHAYLVTARHCIDRARKYGALYLRLNKKDDGEAAYIQVPFDWTVPDDPMVDVAVLSAPISLPRPFQVSVILDSMFLTDEAIEEYGINIGDDVLIVGLFSKQWGKRRNVPIVRTGIIAATPDEPLYDPNTGLSYRGYLLEVRSTGGLSGSPVAVFWGFDRDATGKINKEGREFLIGVVRGHWDYRPDESADVLDDREEIEAVNMGIAIATPIQEVITLLQSEHFVKERRAREVKEGIKNEPTLDWDDDEPKTGKAPERLKIEEPMDAAVKRMFRKGKPPKRRR